MYADNIVRRFLEEDAATAPTPMEVGVYAELAEPGEPMNKERYQRAVGSLMYLVISRPDIAQAVSKVSQYSANPLRAHWTAVRGIVRMSKALFSLV